MRTKKATHAALMALLLAGPAGAQSREAIDGVGFPDPVPTERSEDRPGDASREPEAVAPDAGTAEVGADAERERPKRKRRWWRRDGPLTPEERMERMERESLRQERRQEETRPDATREPIGPTTTTPGQPDTRR